MTWDRLIGYFTTYRRDKITIYTDEIQVWLDGVFISFMKNGRIELKDNYSGSESVISSNRTPDQMYQIITALTEKE